MHGNVQCKVEHIFVCFYAGYGINVTGVNGREIIILFSMCRHAHSCAFISVIELPRIPAYCPKTGSISENDAFYFMNEHLSKSGENPTIETIENVTMKRIQGTIYLDKW